MDLQQTVTIHSVKIFNRPGGSMSRLRDASIFVSYAISMERYNVCARFKSISLELKLSCKVVGRMVQLWMASGILHIREMEVFANWW